jgi:hypothetical protein
MGFYPITYYFIGSYLREYGLKFKTKTLALLLAMATVVFGSFNYYRSYNGGFITGLYQYWYGFQPCFMTILFFALLQRIKANNLPISVRKFLAKISNMTLMIYLVSFIFDKIYYPKLVESVPLMPDRVKYFFVLVIPVFVSSVCLSALLTSIQNIIINLIKKIIILLKKYERIDILRSQTFWYTILMGAAIIFALHKAPLGFGGNDEPFYLTIAHRLSLGDGLFRDEWHLSQMSGFLTMPYVALYRLIHNSTDGIILTTRYTYVIVHAIVSIFAYNRLRKYGFMAIAASILYFIFTPYNIMALCYNTMSLDLLVLSGLLLATFKATRTVPFVLSGLAYAGAVLCCPYLVSGYVLYAICFALAFVLRRLNHCPKFLKLFIFNGRVFMKFTFGVMGLTVAFFGFLMTRISLTEIFDNLPYMLEDPEHPRIPFLDKMRYYFKFTYECHPQFYISFKTYAVVLVAMILDRNRRNHRSFYLLCTLAITFFSYMLFVPKMTTVYYNAIVFPMFFVGVTSYILCKKKPRALFATLFIIGIVYSICVCNTSNQYFYVISMASAICNIASMIFLGVLIKEIRQKPDKVAYGKILANVSLVASCFIILLLSYFEIDTKANHCFWEPQPVSILSKEIEHGPAKGIYTTDANALNYETLYKDLKDAYRGKSSDNILIMSERTWCYIALNNFDYGTYSAWLSGEKDLTLNRLQKFYSLNPKKIPKYVFIPKDTKWDINRILNEALHDGYTYKETEVSYQLERTN